MPHDITGIHDDVNDQKSVSHKPKKCISQKLAGAHLLGADANYVTK
jgi:hypothetical protein